MPKKLIWYEIYEVKLDESTQTLMSFNASDDDIAEKRFDKEREMLQARVNNREILNAGIDRWESETAFSKPNPVKTIAVLRK